MAAFVNAYRRTGPAVLDNALVKIMACLMLARLEGSSPVDYIADLDVDRVRTLVGAMFEDPANTVDYFISSSQELI
jgi:hypothetical protein